jgi:hypothetical protein
MDKRFWISGIVLTVAAAMSGILIHGLMLKPDYAALGPIMRSDEDSAHYMFPWMLLADAAYGFGITWIYRQGWTPGRTAIAQGLRCGFAVALVSTIPMFLIYYAVEPLPGMLVAKQLGFSTVQMLVLGVLAAQLSPSPKVSG